MKKLIYILLFTTVTANALANDKKLHVAAGLLTYVGCITVGKVAKDLDLFYWLDYKTCLVPLAGVAIGKEVYDSRHSGHTAEFMDAVATVAIPFGFVAYQYKF